MKKFALLFLCAFALVACDSPERTVDTLRKQISTYQATPSEVVQEEIEQSFTKLDAQISALEASGKQAEAATLRRQESTLRTDYQAAKMARAINNAKNAIQGIGESLKDVGRSIEGAFQPTNEKSTNENR